jgi:hypothetical protein
MREPREYENPLCAQIGGDFWFPDKEGTVSFSESQYAKSICKSCTHKIECAEWGIHKEQFGIWGGLAPRERLAIRRVRRINLGGDEEVA